MWVSSKPSRFLSILNGCSYGGRLIKSRYDVHREREKYLENILPPKKCFYLDSYLLFFHRGVHISFYPSLLSRRWLRWRGVREKGHSLPASSRREKKGLYVWPRALKWAESDLWWEAGGGGRVEWKWVMSGLLCVCVRHTQNILCACVWVCLWGEDVYQVP